MFYSDADNMFYQDYSNNHLHVIGHTLQGMMKDKNYYGSSSPNPEESNLIDEHHPHTLFVGEFINQ